MPCPSSRLIALAAIVVAVLLPPARGETAAGTPAEAMRLLKRNCFSCHNDEKKKGGLVMTSREKLMAGGEDGLALVAGAPDKSPLITSLADDADPHMPPKKHLAAAQIELLKQWVQQGAT